MKLCGDLGTHHNRSLDEAKEMSTRIFRTVEVTIDEKRRGPGGLANFVVDPGSESTMIFRFFIP